MEKAKKITLSYFVLLAFALCFMALFPLQIAHGGAECGGVETSFDFNCPDNADTTSGDLERSPIYAILLYATNFLSIGIGIGAVAFIVWGAITYASARDNAEQAKKGVTYITNAVIALILFMSMYAIVNFLVPGGILN